MTNVGPAARPTPALPTGKPVGLVPGTTIRSLEDFGVGRTGGDCSSTDPAQALERYRKPEWARLGEEAEVASPMYPMPMYSIPALYPTGTG